MFDDESPSVLTPPTEPEPLEKVVTAANVKDHIGRRHEPGVELEVPRSLAERWRKMGAILTPKKVERHDARRASTDRAELARLKAERRGVEAELGSAMARADAAEERAVRAERRVGALEDQLAVEASRVQEAELAVHTLRREHEAEVAALRGRIERKIGKEPTQ